MQMDLTRAAGRTKSVLPCKNTEHRKPETWMSRFDDAELHQTDVHQQWIRQQTLPPAIRAFSLGKLDDVRGKLDAVVTLDMYLNLQMTILSLEK